ncbi:uncharacterized protein EV154DRAFT_485620 [Mucor mucedo]|uniref:uncharacterized protein n=1 Tax=Mucor mucedo TaxID=29922 RepID=UPI00221EEC6E|nr:uncharacterized protein EV154DRAFT_488973 [Mucor mucedo]XP_051453291.1 uncharacterized protein EV154DRAFT_485620 [Mucor mucedo]KAI7864086.1 hypothetical protein EV154DRAFT_488973 [Mucor mucedo]KAI7882292.1 hypothetical protein EV154DRAFT_485620 [Mucor mucedo]
MSYSENGFSCSLQYSIIFVYLFLMLQTIVVVSCPMFVSLQPVVVGGHSLITNCQEPVRSKMIPVSEGFSFNVLQLAFGLRGLKNSVILTIISQQTLLCFISCTKMLSLFCSCFRDSHVTVSPWSLAKLCRLSSSKQIQKKKSRFLEDWAELWNAMTLRLSNQRVFKWKVNSGGRLKLWIFQFINRYYLLMKIGEKFGRLMKPNIESLISKLVIKAIDSRRTTNKSLSEL